MLVSGSWKFSVVSGRMSRSQKASSVGRSSADAFVHGAVFSFLRFVDVFMLFAVALLCSTLHKDVET